MFSRRGPSTVISMLSSENISRAVRFSSSKVRFCNVETDIFSRKSFDGIGAPVVKWARQAFTISTLLRFFLWSIWSLTDLSILACCSLNSSGVNPCFFILSTSIASSFRASLTLLFFTAPMMNTIFLSGVKSV